MKKKYIPGEEKRGGEPEPWSFSCHIEEWTPEVGDIGEDMVSEESSLERSSEYEEEKGALLGVVDSRLFVRLDREG